MTPYSKVSKEWQENGYYIVNNNHYMSLFTYREKHNLPKVSPSENKKVGLSINPLVCEHIETIPDKGPFDIIKAYDLSYLRDNEGILLF